MSRMTWLVSVEAGSQGKKSGPITGVTRPITQINMSHTAALLLSQ